MTPFWRVLPRIHGASLPNQRALNKDELGGNGEANRPGNLMVAGAIAF